LRNFNKGIIMSSLQQYQKVIAKAQATAKASTKIMEDAATINQLTVSAGPAAGPTTFSVPSAGINFGQAKMLIQSKVSPHSDVKREGDNIVITTNNPRAAVNVLRLLGIAVNIDGTVLNNRHLPTPAVAAPTNAPLGT